MSIESGHLPQKFPDEVIAALQEANISATCMPIGVDGGDQQAAFFYALPSGSACLKDGMLERGRFTVILTSDLHEHDNGTVIEIGIKISTPIESSGGIMLFLTDSTSSQFDALMLLSEQHDISLFIGDQDFATLWQQNVSLDEGFRLSVMALINEAVTRDAIIRMTNRYDPAAVIADIRVNRKIP